MWGWRGCGVGEDVGFWRMGDMGLGILDEGNLRRDKRYVNIFLGMKSTCVLQLLPGLRAIYMS